MKNNNRKTLFIILILFFIFIIPWQMAKRFYLHGGNLFPKAATQHGYLIQPPVKINQLTLYERRENLFDIQKLQGKWLLLYIGEDNCSALCKKNLYQLQQIHSASGKERSRILRIKISFKKDQMPDEYPGFLQLTVNKQQFSNFIKSLPTKALALSKGAIYLADPLGNVIMTYTLDADPSGILKDLKHLLGVSQIG